MLRQHARMSESPLEPDINANYYTDAMCPRETIRLADNEALAFYGVDEVGGGRVL
jgi:hypothetical protein